KLELETIPHDIRNFARILRCGSGRYSGYTERGRHDMIAYGLDIYVHITSPIRRLVDLLNMITIQQTLNMVEFNNNTLEFIHSWSERIDYINTSMRSIKRVQADCYLLEKYMNNKIDLDYIYTGYIFDREKSIKTDIEYKYSVYLPELNIMSEIFANDEYANYSEHKFTIHLFTNEAKLKQKARLQLV
ncbi:MAG: RNB domain-containing ribonuclease, partial [Candidatus Pacebacteria bacterium]|nr:RNB domain-containing ribonuclease [Candidatus Paceibacterota bacterium]